MNVLRRVLEAVDMRKPERPHPKQLGRPSEARGHDYEKDIAALQTAIRRHPYSATYWSWLGEAYFYSRDWEQMAKAYSRAAELSPRNDSFISMRGLAATAVGDWQSARAAWMRIGVPIDDGEGPPIVDMGEALVRLWRSRKVEAIVRGARIDPCRTRLEEVPVPETGNLWHDVVLHALVDWAAWRPLGHPIIFDELERLEPGPYSTVEVDVTVPAATDLADAVARLTRAGLSAEDFSSYRYGCDWCDEYSPHAHDGPGGERIWLTVHRIGVAGAHGAVAAVLREWASAAPGREFTGLHQPGV